MTKKQMYERNKKRSKTLTVITPFVFWGLLALAVIFFILALKHSVGNWNEIRTLLNSKNNTGEELRANYAYLAEKYGEWIIGNGSTGFHITFIDIRAAIFGGFAIFSGVMAFISFVGAFLLGKWIFPALAKKYTQDNQDMANLTVLEMAEEKENKKE